jgi:hypothetical protein
MTAELSYPIHITDCGKTVKPLLKKTSSSSSSSTQYPSYAGPNKAELDAATEKAINSGIVIGVKVSITSPYQQDMVGEVVGFKLSVESPYWRHGSAKTIDDVSCVRCRVIGPHTTYVSSYSLCELELI